MASFYDHQDSFEQLNSGISLSEKLKLMHSLLRKHHDFIDQIVVSLYDRSSDMIRSFAWSCCDDVSRLHCEVQLSQSSSLMEILERGRPRVVNSVRDHEGQMESQHQDGFTQPDVAASYTLPMYRDGEFIGFIFFNSFRQQVFHESVLNDLDMAGHMISMLVASEKSIVDTLQATVRSAMSFTHHRDPETAEHIDRMSRYSRLIARNLADEFGFDDQFIEHIFLFSPLHDLGKICIPDSILLKQGKLTDAEYEIMKSHAVKGREMIDALLKNFGLDGVGYIDMLRNIAQYHHEAYDGSGYPEGLQANEIPIEARIVTVADVFDALTSQRPYKRAWTNDEAFAVLRSMSDRKLDKMCVEALVTQREAIENIQQQFRENPYG